MPPSRRLRRLAVLVLAAPAVLLLAPLSLLLLTADTRAGRVAGGVAFGLLVASVATVVAILRGPAGRPWWAAAGVAYLVALASGITLWRLTPRPLTGSPDGIQALRTGHEEAALPSWSELLPERDAVLLGAGIATRIVPMISRSEAATVRKALSDAYPLADERTGARPASVLLPSLLGSPRVAGHYFAVRPAPRPGERLGMIVFLHGNGGNFLALPWAWRPLADRLRAVVVFPTFGFGFWGRGGVEAVERVRRDALSRFPEVDPGSVWLGGISDGGVGVTRSAAAHPGAYIGLIYVSPTLRPDEIAAPAFALGWRGRRVLILQGQRDWSVTPASVDRGAAALREAGAVVTDRRFPDDGHFLFFARTAEIGDALAAWTAGGDGSR